MSTSMTIRQYHPDDRDKLVDIWLRSVRETHNFLTEDDILSLLPLVRDTVLNQLELWVLCSCLGEPIGFAGLAGSSLEGLFLDPHWTGQGGGKLLLIHTRQLKGPLTVDVNEQNPVALKFYESNGFQIVGRSPVDRGGRPFPLLHLRDTLPSIQ